jgi:U3 small nucleolar RNA-associated protein MPP10
VADVADVADEEGGGGGEEAEMEEADLKERSSDVGESGSEVGSDGEDGDENIDVVPRSSKKVRFSVDNGAAGMEKERMEEDASAGTSGDFEDGFFSLADMEAFGEEAEELAADGKLMADSDEETGDGAHSDDEEEDGDGLGMSLRGKLKGMSSQTGERIRYEDFFDKPGGEKSAGGSTSVETERALRRATMFDDASSDGEEGEEGGAKTPLEVEREKLRDSIAALEDANVSKKPWQLRGEVDAHGRPMNSLLESEFEHDIVARPRVAPTAAASASIEDIIRQRIFDGLFDDVVRKLPADYEEARRKKQRVPLPDISQDKPEEGLADLYEREYAEEREKVSKASEAASHITVREVDPEDNPEQAEVNRLFKRLSNKLDALASLHYTPAPPKMPAEMEVKPNVPALNAEEAIPEAVSDAALLAPREVHTATAKDLQGEVETDKLERRTRRRTKKRHISNDNKRKEGEMRLEEMADPALAEQRRAERTLQRPGKMLQAVANPNDRNKSKKKRGASIRSLEDVGSRTGDFAKSTRFFTHLQQTVEQDLAGKKSNMGARELSNGRTAASLKL